MKYIIHTFILFFSAFQLMAQPYVDLANLQYTRFNQAPFKKDMNASVDHQIWSGGFFLPLPLKNKDRLIIGADNTSINIKYIGSDTSFSSYLQSSSLQIGLLKQWKNEQWNTLFLFIPRLAADFKNIYSTDRQLGGAVVNTYVWKKNVKLKFGLYYNREFFGNYFMPLVGLAWKVNERMNIWCLLPGSLNVDYFLNSRISCGLKYQSITATYRAEGSDGTSYIREGDVFWSDQQISLKADAYLLKNLVLYAGVGITGFHYLQAYDKFHEKINAPPQFQQSRDRGFVYAGLAFRVKTD